MVRNVHERVLSAPLAQVGGVIDRLASRDDVMWPGERWPKMRFDRPLAVGASGGHGPIRYFVEAYEPGRSITFRLTGPKGLDGTHGFETEETASGETLLRHVLTVRLKGGARLSWPLMFRWLHDALIEDALDRAERHITSVPLENRNWSPWVRLLRRLSPLVARRHAAARGHTNQGGAQRR